MSEQAVLVAQTPSSYVLALDQMIRVDRMHKHRAVGILFSKKAACRPRGGCVLTQSPAVHTEAILQLLAADDQCGSTAG